MTSVDPWVNFGLWSLAGIRKVSDLLASLGVRFEVQEYPETEQRFKEWCAWDENSTQPTVGFHLWIHQDDLDTVGDKIVVTFPEIKFGA